jgi:hypothetical protein
MPRKSGRLGDIAGSVMLYVNRIILFKSSTTISILYFYLIGIEIIPNLTIIAAAPFYAHLLYRRLTLLITTTLIFSN